MGPVVLFADMLLVHHSVLAGASWSDKEVEGTADNVEVHEGAEVEAAYTRTVVVGRMAGKIGLVGVGVAYLDKDNGAHVAASLNHPTLKPQ